MIIVRHAGTWRPARAMRDSIVARGPKSSSAVRGARSSVARSPRPDSPRLAPPPRPPPRPPASPFSSGPAATSSRCGRSRAAGQGVDQVARPGVGDDHPARGQHHEDRRAPEADHVVPVEVAGLAAQPGAEERHRAHVPPRPLPRPPQIEPRGRQHEKRRVARARDRAGRRAVLAFDREIAVPARDRSIEGPRTRRARPEHVARVGVDEDRAALSERDGRRHPRIGIERHRRGLRIRHGPLHALQQHVEVEPGVPGSRWLDESLRPFDSP